MATITVWLLVMAGGVYGGAVGGVQPFMFPTAEACEHVAKSALQIDGYLGSGTRGPFYHCVRATVVKP